MDNFYDNRVIKYDLIQHGAVVAVRIYFADGTRTPMADLKFAYSSDMYPERKKTICWVQPQHKEAFVKGISGYTLMYDEREKPSFEELYGGN